MDERPTRDASSPAPAPDERPRRSETTQERYDRNWAELLQEIRVTQMGTQIMTGFLLAGTATLIFDLVLGTVAAVTVSVTVLVASAVFVVVSHRMARSSGSGPTGR